MKSDRNHIGNWVYSKRNNIIADLERIVNIRSVSNSHEEMKPYGKGCRKVLDEMLRISVEKGFKTENYKYHLGATYFNEYNKNKPTVGLWGHLDVVTEGEEWQFPPYKQSQIDNFLIGRGVQDNKGPVIGLLYALQCLMDLKIPIDYNLKLFYGCNEEIGMEDVKYYVENHKVPDLSLVADSGFPVCYGEQGILHLKLIKKGHSKHIIRFKAGDSLNTIPQKAEITIDKTGLDKKRLASLTRDPNIEMMVKEDQITFTAKGKASHVCAVENSTNAIGILIDYIIKNNILPSELPFLQNILRFTADSYGIAANIKSEKTSLGELTGGITLVEQKENDIHMYIDYRYPILDDRGKLMGGSYIVEKIRDICSTSNTDVKVIKHSRPTHKNKNSKIIQTLTDVYQEISGFNNEPFTMGGGTYARILPNSFAYGMALPNKKIYSIQKGHGDYHQPDESIYIDDLLEAIIIYVNALIKLNTLDLSSVDL